MKISIFGLGKRVEKVAKDLAREQNTLSLYFRENGDKDFLLSLPSLMTRPYKSLEEIDTFLPYLADQDAILLLEEKEEDNLFLSRILSVLSRKLHLVVYDPYKYSFLQKNPELFPYNSISCPNDLLAQAVAKFYYQDKGLSTQTFDPFQLSMLKYPIEDQKEFVNRKVKDIGAFEDLVLIGIHRGSEVLVPHGQSILKRNDRIHIVGKTPAIDRFKRRHHILRRVSPNESKRFLLFGTSDQSIAIGKDLAQRGADVWVIGKEEYSKREWRAIFPQSIYKSLRNQGLMDFLRQMDIETFDGLIAASNHDGDNIMAIMAAYNLGIGPSILLIEDESMLFALDTEKVSAIYNRDNLLAQSLKRKITGPKDLAFHLLSSKLEIYEIRIGNTSPAAEKTIEELDLPRGFLIGGIYRKEEDNIVPKGKVRLEEEDRLLIFTLAESAYAIEKFLPVENKRQKITELLNLY